MLNPLHKTGEWARGRESGLGGAGEWARGMESGLVGNGLGGGGVAK